jgi:uncharacterized repeat protein (TIGR01451 family)
MSPFFSHALRLGLSLPFGLSLAPMPVQAATPRLLQGPALDVREEWRRSPMGTEIGDAGLFVADVDGTGGQEVVTAASPGGFLGNSFFYTLRYVNGAYVQDWISDEFPASVLSLRVAQVDADPALEVLVGAGNRIVVFDGATHQVQQEIVTAAAEVRGLAVADVDSDGQLELVFCDNSSLFVYDLASGAQEYAGPGFGGYDLAVGDVDGDGILDIVVGNDEATGYVLNGVTHAAEWAYPPGFGRYVRLGDVDGDGRPEIVAGHQWFTIVVLDGQQHSVQGSIPTNLDIESLRIADVEGDGPLEIVYGDRQGGSIHVHSGQTLLQKWEIPGPAVGVSDLAFGDVDGDGTVELVWGCGGFTSGADYLVVADSVSHRIEWQSLDLTGPFRAFSHGDVDGDGLGEILYGSFLSDAGFGGGIWFVHDAATHALEYQSDPGQPWYGLWRIRNANVDGDPQQEVFVNDSGNPSRILAVDGLTHALEWTAGIPDGLEPVSLAVADVDQDGSVEVLAGTRGDSGFPPYASVYAFDAATGAFKWQSPPLVAGPCLLSLLRVANVDADANPEIVAACSGGRVLVVDGVTHEVADLGDHAATALETADRDGVAEIVVGTDTGNVQVLSPTGTVLETVAAYGTRIDALKVIDVTGDGAFDYVSCTDDRILIQDAGGAMVWDSGKLRYGYQPVVGAQDSLLVADVDDDGKLEILVGLGGLGLREYEIAAARDLSVTIADSPDPVLVGDTVTFTVTAANAAAQPAQGTTVTTIVGSGLTLLSSVPGPPTCTPTGPTLSCDFGALAGGATAVVSVTTQAVAPGTTTTEASVSCSVPDPVPLNNVDSETTTVTQSVEADLAMGVDDGRFVASPGQAMSYALTVTNQGPWPVSGVVLANYPPLFLMNPVLTPGSGTYDPATGDWTGLDLGSGSSATMYLTGTLDPAAFGLLAERARVWPDLGVTDPVSANDEATDTDVIGTGLRELVHGSAVTNPQWVADRYGFYRLAQRPRSSYEVVLDGTTDLGGVFVPVLLERVAPDLTTVLQTGTPLGAGWSRVLRWENPGGADVDDEVVRLAAICPAPVCGPEDAYRLRAYDTTATIPRFNNSASQVTVVVLQNPTNTGVSGTLWFWDSSGALLASQSFVALDPRRSLVLNTSTIAALLGQSGSITVSHDAGYGRLNGKAVAVEPATGFTFDSPLTWRPR